MASIIQRGGNWRAMIRRKGASLAKTFDTEAEARAWADAEEARIKAGATAAQVKRMPSGLTVAELFERYARDVSPEKGGWRFEVNALRKLAGHFPMAAAELDGAAMAEWRDRRLKEVKASTGNLP